VDWHGVVKWAAAITAIFFKKIIMIIPQATQVFCPGKFVNRLTSLISNFSLPTITAQRALPFPH
jgi:hypothetical protein